MCTRLLLLVGIGKPIPSMEDAEVVDVLDVPLLEIEPKIVLLCGEVDSVEGLCLRLCDGRDLLRAGQTEETREDTPGVLDDSMGVFAVEERAGFV